MLHRRHLIITGRVQGVFYRNWFVDQAKALGVDGWVRNRVDGSVEAVIQGPSDATDALIEQAHTGPPAARVAGIVVDEDVSVEILHGFSKRATL